jgi:DNA-binding phage protein
MEDIGARLRQAETRRQVALREAKAASAAFRSLLLEAVEQGMSRAEAARQAGVSRESVYRILGRR